MATEITYITLYNFVSFQKNLKCIYSQCLHHLTFLLSFLTYATLMRSRKSEYGKDIDLGFILP
jgi:hypothetical protein